MNQQLYQQLLDAGKVLLAEQKAKNEIEQLRSQIKRNTDEIEAAKKKINQLPPRYILKMVFGICDLIAGIPLTLGGCGFTLVALFSELTSDLLSSIFLAAFLFVLMVLPFLILSITGIILLISNPISKKRYTKKAIENHKRIKEQKEAENTQLTHKINQIADEAVSHWNNNVRLLDFLPEDYCNVHAVGFMLKAVKNLRADTLKEAINLYDQELKHLETMAAAERQRLQNEELLYTMELLNLNMETMNANQERANRKLDDISFMQTMQIFDD